jgi:hypothetical protein
LFITCPVSLGQRRRVADANQIEEPGMRKISGARSPKPDRPIVDTHRADTHRADTYRADTYREDTRQRRIPGATITSWPGAAHIDLATFFGRTVSDTTVTGAAGQPEPFRRTAKGTVALSDGTRITFATVGPFDMVELA